MLFSDEYFLLDRVCLVQYHKRIYLPKYNLVNKNRYYRKQKRLELREDFRITLGRGTQQEGPQDSLAGSTDSHRGRGWNDC